MEINRDTHCEGRNIDILRSDSDADPVIQILHGGLIYKVMMQAIDLGILDDLEHSSDGVSVSAFANQHNYDVSIVEKLFNTLTCSGILEKGRSSVNEGDYVYRNSASTRRYLTHSRQPSLLGLCKVTETAIIPMMRGLPYLLQSGTPVSHMTSNQPTKLENEMSKLYLNANRSLADDDVSNGNVINNRDQTKLNMAEMWRNFLLAMDGWSATTATAAARAFDLQQHRVAVDLGGASGRLAAELTTTYPDMSAVVFDLPHVIMATKEMFSFGDSDITFVPGDFLKDELPSADLYLLSHVLHVLNDSDRDALMTKIYNKLPAGGSVLVVEKVLQGDKTGPAMAVTNDLYLSLQCTGGERTLAEYWALFARHGFRNLKFKPITGFNYADVMLATKPF